MIDKRLDKKKHASHTFPCHELKEAVLPTELC